MDNLELAQKIIESRSPKYFVYNIIKKSDVIPSPRSKSKFNYYIFDDEIMLKMGRLKDEHNPELFWVEIQKTLFIDLEVKFKLTIEQSKDIIRTVVSDYFNITRDEIQFSEHTFIDNISTTLMKKYVAEKYKSMKNG
jgi:hypothetical protein